MNRDATESRVDTAFPSLPPFDTGYLGEKVDSDRSHLRCRFFSKHWPSLFTFLLELHLTVCDIKKSNEEEIR